MRDLHIKAVVILDKLDRLQQEIQGLQTWTKEWGSFWNANTTPEIKQKKELYKKYKAKYNKLIKKIEKL